MRTVILIYGLLFSLMANAVQLSDDGVGDAIVFPFYTVENNHRSELSFTNNTATVKAVKVMFYDRFANIVLLSFHVYLAPMDSWSAELDSIVSNSVPGEPTTFLTPTDNSCAPFVNPGQEMRPFAIDDDSRFDAILDRAQTGTIVLIDLGEVLDPEAQNIVFTNNEPNDCQQIEDNWRSQGVWGQDPGHSMGPVVGGLSANLVVRALDNGSTFEVDPTVLKNTLNTGSAHVSPGSTGPNLNHDTSHPELLGLLGTPSYGFEFNSQHIIALLQKTAVSTEFDFTQSTDVRINWVVTLMNKMSYYFSGITQLRPPFTSTLNAADNGACDVLTVEVRDELGVLLNPALNAGFSLCESTNVIPIKPFGEQPMPILDDSYRSFINVGDLQKGSITLKTKADHFMLGQNINSPNEDDYFYGLPITGFQLTQLDDGFNPVQYQAQAFSSEGEIVIDLIWANDFEAP